MRRTFLHASRAEILRFARTLRGKTLGQLESEAVAFRPRNKGEFGTRLEGVFGLPAKPAGFTAVADFQTAKIELKSTELIRRARGWSVRWRTSVGMINLQSLREEKWDAATVRKKLGAILFVFYRRELGQRVQDYVIDDVCLWSPSPTDLAAIRADWESIRARVTAGEALSESQTLVLGAATKGPRNSTSRAFSLKRPFVEAIYRAAKGGPDAAPTIVIPSAEAEMVAVVARRFAPFIGRQIREVASELGIRASTAKDYSARVTWAILGAPGTDAPLLGLDQFGVTRRIVPVGPNGKVIEHTSLAPFRIQELLLEDWDGSLVKERTARMLLVPLRSERGGDQGRRVIGEPLVWRPNARESEIIRSEWVRLRGVIKSSGVISLPKPREMQILHVRTKGQDARDTDRDPLIGDVPRRAFCLNSWYMTDVVAGSAG